MSKHIETAEVLEAAADHIAVYGWSQGDYGAAEMRCCAVGALRVVADSLGDFPLAFAAQSAVERLVSPDGDYSVQHWNDHPSRTADEVIMALMEAAAEWRCQNGETP